MNMSQHSHFTGKIAVIVLFCSIILPLGRAQESGTKPTQASWH